MRGFALSGMKEFTLCHIGFSESRFWENEAL